MQRRRYKLLAVGVAAAMTLPSSPSRAMTEDDGPTIPAGGYGSAPGTSYGGVADSDTVNFPGISVTGRRSDKPVTLSPIYVVNVAAPSPPPGYSGGGSPAPTNPAQQQQCIADCDTKQKMAKDLCDVAAAKAAASATVTAIGVGFVAGAFLTWKAGLFGIPGGFGAYLVTNQLAKDHAATMNLACIAKAAEDHTNCIRGICKFTG